MDPLGSLGQAEVSSQQAWQLVQLWLQQQQLLDPQRRVALQLQQADGHGVPRRSGNLIPQGLLHLQARTGSQDTLQLSQGIPQASTASQGRSGSNKRNAPCLLPRTWGRWWLRPTRALLYAASPLAAAPQQHICCQ